MASLTTVLREDRYRAVQTAGDNNRQPWAWARIYGVDHTMKRHK